ncbi:unnamed protein product [Symbiodinium necroappetens]|uniref:Uncharacterized protein n=1 Tax=Symbiodinium necroappetens TaxID=1628268 RepID=A0A813BMN7_9DINO|nr:unnamed protein product [Symbiodinium necroappetens]
MAFTLQRRLRVSKGELGWVPPDEVLVDGKLYVKFYKWDSYLVHIMTGKQLYLNKAKSASSGSLDCELWDDLVKSRQEAANALLTQAKNVDEGAEPQPKKKPKIQRETSKSMLLLPETVEVTCRGYQLRMLLRGLGTQVLWLEATIENLEWFYEKVQSSAVKPRKEKSMGKKQNRKEEEDDEASQEGCEDEIPE